MATHYLPVDFVAFGSHCGIKQDADKRDLAMFASRTPCHAAGVFTTNRVCGAPVLVSRQRVPADNIRGVIINSGNANACTGQQGMDDAELMTLTAAASLGCDSREMLVCSTGIIGHFLPMQRIEQGIGALAANLGTAPEDLQAAAEAMMTTDTFPKISSRELAFDEKTVRITGVAKGAAMIAPHMATMLAVIMTDAGISEQLADQMLRQAVDCSFHCISVDGHTSTSDSVLLLANAASKTEICSETDRIKFQNELNAVCMELAQSIVRDGEGAEHFITIDVSGLPKRSEAFAIARAIADSALVKTAITGGDPNWGRIVSAAGYAGVEFEESDVSLWLNDHLIYEAGTPRNEEEKKVAESLKNQRDVHLDIRFGRGESAVRFWTTDLTAEYVRLNSEYTT